METTNTLKNLLAIYNSMANIKEIDRSDYFKNYFNELKWRIESERQLLSLQLDSVATKMSNNTTTNETSK